MSKPLRYLLSGLRLSAGLLARAQAPTHLTISGYVRSQATGESLPGVTVLHPASGLGTATNTYGFYSLTLPTASLDLVRLVVTRVRAAVGYGGDEQLHPQLSADAGHPRAGGRGGGRRRPA